MDWLLLFLKGLLVGLCASIPLGPIGVICIQQTLNKGRLSGLASGYGAALADTTFATIALLGLSAITGFIHRHEVILQYIGGGVILILGIIIFLRNPIKQFRKSQKGHKSYAQDILYVYLLTLTNPLTIFFLMTLFAMVKAMPSMHIPYATLHVIVAILGVHLGAFSWWFTLTYCVNRFRKRIRLRQLCRFNRIAGIAIMALGALAIFATITHIDLI